MGLIFVLFLVLVALALLGGGAFAIAAWLRHEQMDTQGDKIEADAPKSRRRPQHLRVENEQRAHLTDGH